MLATVHYTTPTGSMEQGFLNQYYPHWMRLPYIFNAPANLYLRSPRMWNRQLRVVHFTFGKPWESPAKSPHYIIPLRPVYQLWWDMYDEMGRALASTQPVTR